MKQILIIEDDPEIIKLLEIHLTDLIYSTAKAMDGVSTCVILLQS